MRFGKRRQRFDLLANEVIATGETKKGRGFFRRHFQECVSFGRRVSSTIPLPFVRISPTFADIAKQVLLEKQLAAKETKLAATRQINRLILSFGPIRIKEITDQSWVEYVIRERLKRDRTFYDDRKYMRIILGTASRLGHRPNLLRLPIPDLPWDAGRELSVLELSRLRHEAGSELRFQIDIAWKMGLRLREMLRLRWDQINWERGTIRLRVGDVKTRKGREIPINPDLLPEFQARFPDTRSLWVFPNLTNTGPIQNNKTAWGTCKAKSGVEARWHDLRHTCATLMLRAGVPRHIVRAYLGMSEPVLDRIYAHLNLADLKSAALLMTDAARPVGVDDLRVASVALSEMRHHLASIKGDR